jgi:hypothetical protein
VARAALRLAKLLVEPGTGCLASGRQMANDHEDTPIRDLMDIGGWKSSKTLIECYQRPNQNRMQRAMAAGQSTYRIDSPARGRPEPPAISSTHRIF